MELKDVIKEALIREESQKYISHDEKISRRVETYCLIGGLIGVVIIWVCLI